MGLLVSCNMKWNKMKIWNFWNGNLLMICKIEIANYRFLFCKSLAYFHFINDRFHKKLTPFQSPELEVRKKNYKTFWNCFLSILIVIIFLFLWDNATLSYVEFKVWDTLCWRATSCGFWWTITFTNIIQWNNFCCITWKRYVLS